MHSVQNVGNNFNKIFGHLIRFNLIKKSRVCFTAHSASPPRGGKVVQGSDSPTDGRVSFAQKFHYCKNSRVSFAQFFLLLKTAPKCFSLNLNSHFTNENSCLRYIYSLEQEKTRLLSQNCQLKRLIGQYMT